jgi:hypothetical protein
MNAELKLDNEGICAITDNESLVVIIEMPNEGPLVHIYTPLCPMLDGIEPNYALLERAMELNLLGLRTRGGTLGLDVERKEIFFSFVIEIETCEAMKFSNILQNFMETAKALKTELELTTQALATH